MNSEEYAQHQRSQAIANNDAWHKRNIEAHLPEYVEACRTENFLWPAKAMHEYASAESARLKAKIEVMERHGIERWPTTHSPHRELAEIYWQQAKGYIDANIAKEQARKREREGQP